MVFVFDCNKKKSEEVTAIKETKVDTIKVDAPKVDASKVSDSIPPCIRNLINGKYKNEPEEAPVRIDEYLYNGQQVYLFMGPCCDNYDVLYDKNCKEICAPTGGFSGRGDGKCPDFTKESKLIRTIWNNDLKN